MLSDYITNVSSAFRLCLTLYRFNFSYLIIECFMYVVLLFQAIHGYRETERSEWNATNTHILLRLKDFAFKDVNKPTEFVHVLDLEKDGLIKPHKDSVRVSASLVILSICIKFCNLSLIFCKSMLCD